MAFLDWLGPIGTAAEGIGSLAAPIVSGATRSKPTGTTHQAKLNLKYGKLYDEWAAKNMPRLNREGMEAAGFNPILAINSGQSAHGFSGVSGHSGMQGIDVDLSGVNSAVKSALALKQAEANIDATESQTKLNNAKTELTNFQRENPSNPLQFLLSGRDKLREFGERIGEKVGSWIGGKLYPVPKSSASGNYHNRNHNRNNNTIYINFGGSGSSGSGSSASSIIGPVNSDF